MFLLLRIRQTVLEITQQLCKTIRRAKRGATASEKTIEVLGNPLLKEVKLFLLPLRTGYYIHLCLYLMYITTSLNIRFISLSIIKSLETARNCCEKLRKTFFIKRACALIVRLANILKPFCRTAGNLKSPNFV